MKVLVTGSSGQLGSFVCELISNSHDVVGFDIRPQQVDSLKRMCVLGDVTVPEEIKRALTGVKAVVHCAAQVSVEKSTQDPLSDAKANVLGTVSALHESADAGVTRFVYISSAAVLGQPKYIPIDESHPTEPISNYGASKLAGEKYALTFARNSPMEVVCVRPFNFYSVRADPSSPYSGVITKFAARLKAGKPPVIEGDGGQSRDFIHARDVAEMIHLTIDKRGLNGQVLNCGSGKPTSIFDLAVKMIILSGGKLKPEFGPARTGDIRESLSNSTKAMDMLGFKPKVSLEEGLAEMLR